jgi:hypothetical protein
MQDLVPRSLLVAAGVKKFKFPTIIDNVKDIAPPWPSPAQIAPDTAERQALAGEHRPFENLPKGPK